MGTKAAGNWAPFAVFVLTRPELCLIILGRLDHHRNKVKFLGGPAAVNGDSSDDGALFRRGQVTGQECLGRPCRVLADPCSQKTGQARPRVAENVAGEVLGG